jgi:hypothetical protein
MNVYVSMSLYICVYVHTKIYGYTYTDICVHVYSVYAYTEVYTYIDRKSKENLTEVPEISEESRLDTQSRVKEKILKCREIQVNGLHSVC